MPYYLIVVVVKILDPISFILCLLITKALINKVNKYLLIFIVSVSVAVIVETFIAALDPVRSWGHRIEPGLIAAFVQTLVSIAIYRIWSRYKEKRNKY
jgi:hypothetical protein